MATDLLWSFLQAIIMSVAVMLVHTYHGFNAAGGPVGVDNLAAAIGEARDTIEDVLEPYLIQQGYLQRTLRGRIATPAIYRHLGLAEPASSIVRDLLADDH